MMLIVIATLVLPILAFGVWISYLVVPPVIKTVVPEVVGTVRKALDK